jgi:PAS domain S-box-containing protein
MLKVSSESDNEVTNYFSGEFFKYDTNKLFRDLVEKAGIAILIDDAEGKIRYFNKRFADLFGYTLTEMNEKKIMDLIHPDDLVNVISRHDERFCGSDVEDCYTFAGIKKTGEKIHLEVSVTELVKDGKVVGTRSYIQNISDLISTQKDLEESRSSLEVEVHMRTQELAYANERLRNEIKIKSNMEKDLKVSYEKYKTITNNIAIGIFRLEIQGCVKFLESNPALVTMFGFNNREELYQHKFVDFFINQDEKNVLYSQIRAYGFVKDYRLKLKKKDGSILITSLTGSVVYDKNGIRYADGILNDITQTTNFQQEIIEEKNRANFYLDLIGHDIGNLHQGIYSWLEINQKTSDDKIREKSIKNLNNLIKRSMILVRNVLILSKIKDKLIDYKSINIAKVIEESTLKAGNLIPWKIPDIRIDIKDPELMINAEPIIDEVFFNIINNSIKFFDGDKPRIDILVSSENDDVVIDIIDRGPGMPDEMKKDLFNRFERSAERSHTGIGLSLVKVIVTRYNGTIVASDRVDGDSSKGTKMTIKFPKA